MDREPTYEEKLDYLLDRFDRMLDHAETCKDKNCHVKMELWKKKGTRADQ